MDDNDFSVIEPNELRVRLSIEEPNELQAKDVKLVMKFDNQDDSHTEYQYTLELLNIKEIDAVERWFGLRNSKKAYEFKLTPLSRIEFSRYLKNRKFNPKPKKYFWTVYYYLKNAPKQTKELTIDVELKFSSEEDYFYLLKDAPIKVDSN